MLQRLHASFTWRDPCSHPQTGPPDSATSPAIVLYSRALCARLCVLELPPSPAGPVFGFGSQLPPRLRILHVCTRAHTLSLDSFCRPTAGKSSIPAGLSPLVYAYVVDCASASHYAYSSSTHRFPDERTPIEATPLSATSVEVVLASGFGISFTVTLLLARALLLLATLHSHTIPFPRVH